MIPFALKKFEDEELSGVTITGTFSFTRNIKDFGEYAEFLKTINDNLPDGLKLEITDTTVQV